uniref:Uncharacterized protein n=2 Tax=Tetranychus urticae TaxID=32264 RepID=T1K9H1_TETUR
MHSELSIFLLFSVFSSISSDNRPPGFGEYNGSIFISSERFGSGSYFLGPETYYFTFPLRLPHWIGDKLRYNQMVIRTFPTESNDFKENTELTKNISLEMETSCGSSKSALDETDVVSLTLMEKRNNHSVAVRTIQIDPLSVDFYSPKLTMKQFNMLAEEEIQKRNEYCNLWCLMLKLCLIATGSQDECSHTNSQVCPNGPCTCLKTSGDHTQSLAEMEKFVKIMKYLELFQYKSSSCTLDYWRRYEPIGIVELDNKTVSSFPKLNNNHYFVASFTDTKARKSAALILKDFKIV